MAKKRNAFQRYFENFGLKQLCDILIIVSLITLIVGWIIWKTTEIVLIVSLGLFVLTALLGIIRSVKIIHNEPNKRSPERRSAIVSLVLMLAIFAVALFALIYGVTTGFSIPSNN